MLKKLVFLLIFSIAAIVVKADDGQKIASKVQKVTVFLSGAQVTRTATVNVGTGTSTLIFENLSPGIDVPSIQVHADGEFTILSVKHELNFLNEQVKQKHAEELRIAQKEIKGKITFQNNLLLIYAEEESMLTKNQVVTGENASLDVLKLKQALDFQTEQLTELKKKEQAVNDLIATLTIEQNKYNDQIAEILKGSSTATSNILVTVSSKTAMQSAFTISYVVRNASWFPSYDIRAKDVNSPITISYKANVSQQSGEEWKNIKLTLSTGNPTVSGNRPQLNPNYLNFAEIYPIGNLINTKLKEVTIQDAAPMSVNETEKLLQGQASGVTIRGVNTMPVEINQTENQTNVEFNIENPYSVPADGKQYTVEINQLDLRVTYQYAVAPKLSTDVFLTAQLTDWNKYNFLSGEANLFFEGTYIGKSRLDTYATADTLKLSLGVDKNIVVTRTLQKELSVRQSLGSNKKETKDWLIEIKNRKNQAINLLVEDQVPVSQSSAVEVEVQETSGAKPDLLTGKVSWNFSLKPQDDKKVELKYQVKYPKNETVIVQ